MKSSIPVLLFIALWGTSWLSLCAEPTPPVSLEKATQLVEEGRVKEARRETKKALSHRENWPEAWVLLSRCSLSQKHYRKAAAYTKKALKYDPRFTLAFYWRGQAYEAWGRLDEAANEYQAALLADPTFENAQKAWNRLKDQASVPEQ